MGAIVLLQGGVGHRGIESSLSVGCFDDGQSSGSLIFVMSYSNEEYHHGSIPISRACSEALVHDSD